MPWVLEEAFAAGGLDLHSRGPAAPSRPALPARVGERRADLDFFETRPDAGGDRALRRARRPRARRLPRALQADLRGGHPRRRPAGVPAARVRALRAAMVRLGAALPLHRSSRRFFRNPRVREAISFHSLFIGGDPYRVPAIYGALVYLQLLDGVWYTDGGVYSVVEAMARPLDVRCGARVGASRPRRPRPRRRLGAASASPPTSSSPTPTRCACTSCSAAARRGRRLRPDDVVLPALPGHRPALRRSCPPHLLVGRDYRDFIRDVTRRGACQDVLRLHPRAHAHRGAMAPAGGDSLVRPAARSPTCAPARLDARPTAARLAGRRPRADVRADRARASVARRAADDAPRLPRPARRRGGQRLRPRADAAPVRLVPPAQPRRPRRRALPRRRRDAPGRRHPRRRARRRGHRRPRPRRPRGGVPRPDRRVPAPKRARAPRRAGRADLRSRLPPAAARGARRRLPALPRLPHAGRPRRHGDPDASARVAAVERWAAGGPASARETAILADLAARHALPRDALRDFCAGMRDDLEREPIRTEADLDRYCYRVAGTVGVVMASVLGARRPRPPVPPPPRSAGDAAHEHPPRHRRGPRRRPRVPRRSRRGAAVAGAGRREPRPARADRPRRRPLRPGHRRHPPPPPRPRARSAPPPSCTARSCARSSARATARPGGAGDRPRTAASSHRRLAAWPAG